MSSNQSEADKLHGIIVSPSAGLAKHYDGGTSALSEIISRSLLHIQTSRDLVVPARRAGEEHEFEIAPGVKIVMCWIPPGDFLMGKLEGEESRDDDETQHRVEITQGFWLAKTQTTQAQWQAVMGKNPSGFKGDDLPVESVSWNDICGNKIWARGFLKTVNRVSQESGRFVLPTEAQWEYACRAGTTGSFAGDLDKMAWYVSNSGDKTHPVKTHPVGKKKPNAWGLHDMHGNVWEWCADWHADYGVNAVADPRGPASGTDRVSRGGSCASEEGDCRAAVRGRSEPEYANEFAGFRLIYCSFSSEAGGGSNGTQQAQRGSIRVAE